MLQRPDDPQLQSWGAHTFDCNWCAHVWMSNVATMNEPCHRDEWVMSQRWMSRVTQILASRITHPNTSHHTSTRHTATLCNTLQHSATHRNTLQHTATYCNTLQHIQIHHITHEATHCNTLQHTATLCNTPQHTATHCNTLQHTATHCNTLQHTATHCNTLQCTAMHCNTFTCGMTCSYGIWLQVCNHMCDMTHLHVWRDSFICVACLISDGMQAGMHSYVWHDLFTCVAWLLVYMRGMLHFGWDAGR